MLHNQIFRQPAPGAPRVLAVFSYRYDAHLVPDLLENIRPGVHGFVAWDDRDARESLSDEIERRRRLLAAAQDLGADWLLAVDPDERFERGIADWLPALVDQGEHLLWTFTLREMFDPGHYRVDGLWGSKKVMRLFPVAAVDPKALVKLHGRWVGETGRDRERPARINLYHLRMALPARRQLRRDLYAAADPDRRYQPVGYDYLADTRGMSLEQMPDGRDFLPPFVEDGGLWAPDPGDLGEIGPDPYEARLVFAARSARRQGHLAAQHAMEDLARDSPQDHDLLLLSARMALLAGACTSAVASATRALTARPGDLLPLLVRAEALLALGDHKAAEADLSRLSESLPDSPVVDALRAEAARSTADFTAPDAAWRSLAPADAVIHEGPAMIRSDIASVVLAFRSQPGLLAAVQSLLGQDAATEIVVVNSGGGSVARDLAPVADRIRLITCETPLFVGAARNVGVAASRAPFVAFLAADCLALPGWVSGRLSLHRAGAAAVSSAVVPADDRFLSRVANGLTYANRNPATPQRLVQHYGQSYARQLLRHCGLFPPGLRIGEDTVLNKVAEGFTRPVWAPGVRTAHRDPETLREMVADARARGRRRVAFGPLRQAAGTGSGADTVARLLRIRLAAARRLAESQTDVSPAERRALLATQWLVAVADAVGTLEGRKTLAEAKRQSSGMGDTGSAPADGTLAGAEAAWALDPHDTALARRLGRLRLAAGDTAGAEAAFRAALAVDPADATVAALLANLALRTSGPLAALAVAERAALAAPTSAPLWAAAAERAVLAGRPDWAVALGQIALSLALASPAQHAALSRLHARAGNPLAAAFRAHTGNRLQAALAVRRE